MFDFLKRSQLVKRGLASGKTRRRRAPNELLRKLEYASYTKYLIFTAFIIGLAFLIFSGQQPEPTKNFVIALLFFVTAMTQLWINQPKTFSRSFAAALRFRRIFVQLAVTKGSARSLQQRNVSLSQAGNRRADCALRFGAAGAERSARPQPRLVCGRFRQSCGAAFCSAKSMRRCLFAD